MANYYLSKYKNIYRLKAPYDLSKNDFSRNPEGEIECEDVYIDCQKGMIYHYGHSTLVCYVPKLGTGRNILKSFGEELGVNIKDYTFTKEKKDGTPYIDKDGKEIKFYDYDSYYKELNKSGIIFDIEETDEEILWKFKDKDIELMAKYMKPKNPYKTTSPFNKKYLPKNKYDIPDSDLQEYKNITDKLGKGNTLIISHLTKKFISNIPKNFNQFKGKDIRSMQKKEALKSKEFIHKIGLWNGYIKYLKENIN